MKTINLPLILDTVLSFVCLFFSAFACLNYFIKDVVLSTVFSTLISALGSALFFLYSATRRDAKLLLNYDKKQTELLSLHLFLSKDNYVLDLFAKCLDARKENDCIKTQSEVFFTRLDVDGIERKDVAQIIKRDESLQKTVICISASQNAMQLAERFDVKIITVAELYPTIKSKGLLPEKYNFNLEKRTPILKKIKLRFNKKLFTSLFLSGLGLLFLSNFTLFPIYYIICGGILTLSACICLFFKA